MTGLIEFLANPYTQAVVWMLCICFSIYLAIHVKKLSFGGDTGTRAWSYISVALFLIGLRVSFKVIFPNYLTSYTLQMLRFIIGIIGILILYIGIKSYQSTLKKIIGVNE